MLAKNKSTKKEIKRHFNLCSKDFIYTISKRISIEDYADKLYELAERYEAWESDCLIGFIAIYLNKGMGFPAYITNISVIEKKQGLGIGHQLMSFLFEDLLTMNYKTVRLEVSIENFGAIRFYHSLGFYQVDKNKSNIYLQKSLE